MNKTTQIIVRMTDQEKTDLENTTKKNNTTVSKLIRDFISNYIQEHKNK